MALFPKRILSGSASIVLQKEVGHTEPFTFSSQLKKRKDQVTRKQDNAKAYFNKEELKQLLAEDRDLLKVIVEQTVQQVLEAEMEEALQASKSERTEARLGYRAGYYSRTLITRVGKIKCKRPRLLSIAHKFLQLHLCRGNLQVLEYKAPVASCSRTRPPSQSLILRCGLPKCSCRTNTSTFSICRTHERPMFTDAGRRSGFLWGQPWAGTAEKQASIRSMVTDVTPCYVPATQGLSGLFSIWFTALPSTDDGLQMDKVELSEKLHPHCTSSVIPL
jgi:hypothetical protein